MLRIDDVVRECLGDQRRLAKVKGIKQPASADLPQRKQDNDQDQAAGIDHPGAFRVEPRTRYRSTITDYGYGGFGHFGHRWGGGFDTAYGDTYPITNYTAYADIVMMKGKKDTNDVHAFSADEVIAKLGPSIYFGKAAQPPGSNR